uniref:Pre-mRNA splicing Prp18-interacting factor n=1 Tax=Tanacetum cinerariifolium TaxID=118510 RepID=A0A6L2NT42_TANCI|nr:pre-mRNA splicing Prp18-interacting factor [Tanacetum cinerariifolium]
MSTFVLCVGCGTPLYGFSHCRWCTCERCGIDLLNGFCPLCNSRNSCVYDPNSNSFDCPPDSYHPPQPTYETYSDDSCGNDYHFGTDCFDQSQPPQFPVIHPPPQEISIEILHDQENAINSVQTFLRKFNRISFFETPKELAEYINTPCWNRLAFYNSSDDDDEDCTIAITSDFLITDTLSMGDVRLDTIPEKELDEFIKSSVEDLVPNPSEFKDECECDVPNCDDSQTTHFLTFSNPLFNDSTSSDDESSHEEVIHEISFKTYSNPLFDLDEEIISSEFNPIHNEDLDSTPKNDRFDMKSYLLESLLNRDESIPPGIDSDDSDFEGDNLSLERLLHDDLIPFPDILEFSNVV